MSFMLRTRATLVLLAGSMFLAVFFSACADKIKTDIIVFKAMDEGLINSNNTIDKYTQTLLVSLDNKLAEPSSRYKAEIWKPKATHIYKITSDIMKYIEGLKIDLKGEAGLKKDDVSGSFKEADKNAVIRLFDKKEKGKELYERLEKYKADMLSVDSQIAQTFQNTFIVITQAFDSSKSKQEDFNRTFFDDIPTVAALAVLSKFQNNVKNLENRMIAFCDNKIGSTDGYGFYTTYSPIAVISSSYLKAGEEIEITAGIGSFSKAALPVVIINGKNIPLGETGAAISKFKAPDKSGKHIVPVEISYIDQDGKKQTIIKNIEYTVAN